MKKIIGLGFILFLGFFPLIVNASDSIQDASLKAEDQPAYDPLTQARIRIYGQNGKKIYIQDSFDCAGKKKGIRTYASSVGGWNAFKSYARWSFNHSLGMPKTAIQKQVLTNTFQTYLLVSFKELAVAANQPVNLHGVVLSAKDSARTQADVIQECENAVASFSPKVGHAYEVLGSYENNQCHFKIYDLASNELVTHSDQAYECPKKSWTLFGKDSE